MAILLTEIGIRRFVIPKSFCFGVEDDIPAQARGDVAQVADRRGQPADLHIRIGPLAAPDTVEKIPLMRKMVGPTELESVTSTVSR